jgi:hypothetical protein
MAWSQVEVDAVRAAIVALATGTRAVSISYAGPPARSVTYSDAQLGDLRALLSEMERSAGGSPKFRRVAFNKGFDS